MGEDEGNGGVSWTDRDFNIKIKMNKILYLFTFYSSLGWMAG